jgi:hypothetical protein
MVLVREEGFHRMSSQIAIVRHSHRWAQLLSRQAPRELAVHAANDNDLAKLGRGTLGREKMTPPEHLLRAALVHFAEHGLGAARAARKQAERAFFAGDRHGYDHWIAITRTLDRRLALEAERIEPHRRQRES